MSEVVAPPTGVVGWLVLAAFGGAVVHLCWFEPFVRTVIAIVVGVNCVVNMIERRRQHRIGIERHGESICSFARAFDCRATDTWIIRAVFEELTDRVQFPVRPDDRIEADLKVDPDDVDDIVAAIAQRTGRSLEHEEANSLHRKVTTVRELVVFFVNQPRRSSLVVSLRNSAE